jgi:hypothetical protein
MLGLGKALATLLAVADMPKTEILIACPKGAVAQDHTSLRFTTQGCQVINYERIKSLRSLQAAWINYILTIRWLW